MKSKNLKLIACLLLVLILLPVFAFYKFRASAEVNSNNIQTSKVEVGKIQELIAASGTLEPFQYVDVGTRISGQIKKIYSDVGSDVQAGGLLVEIDPALYQADVNARKALLKSQIAELSEREAQLILSQWQLSQQKLLHEAKATSTESLKIAEATAKIDQSKVFQERALVEQTQSGLLADQVNLEYTKIFSPIDGQLISLSVKEGQTVNASQQTPVILRIANLSKMTVVAQVSEGDVNNLRKGMDCFFTILGGNRRWNGTLRKLELTPSVVNNVVLYRALFEVNNNDRLLLPQMTAQIFFVRKQAEKALIVPASAVNSDTMDETELIQPGVGWISLLSDSKSKMKDSSQPESEVPQTGTVQVMSSNGVVSLRKVHIGIRNRASVQIISGLTAQDRVVVTNVGASQ